MFLVHDYQIKLKPIVEVRDFCLYEYKPSLSHLLLIPFERQTFVRRIRLLLELFRGGYKVYYLFTDRHLVGYCVVTPGGRRLKISTPQDIVLGPYYIHPEYRGRGYAKKIIKLTLANCSYDFRYTYDWIEKKNVGSIKASEACGFRECGQLNVEGYFRRLVETDNGDDIIYRYSKPSKEN